MLTAQYDALVTGPTPTADGRVRFEVRNVGKAGDSYDFQLTNGAVPSPATATIDPTESVTVTAVPAREAEFVVVSRGRGDEVARVPTGT